MNGSRRNAGQKLDWKPDWSWTVARRKLDGSWMKARQKPEGSKTEVKQKPNERCNGTSTLAESIHSNARR